MTSSTYKENHSPASWEERLENDGDIHFLFGDYSKQLGLFNIRNKIVKNLGWTIKEINASKYDKMETA